MNDLSRRDLLRGGGIIALGLVTPKWLSTLAEANVLHQAAGGRLKDTVLVVCQLSGGNDGLNTVVPYRDATYRSLRPTLAIGESEVLPLNDALGLHPSMKGMADLYKRNKVAIVQGVGYPSPSRSHFRSMDIWQSASPDLSVPNGWVGRHFDAMAAGAPLNPVVALGLSSEKPRALNAKEVSIPCFASLADIETMIGDPDFDRLMRQMQGTSAAPSERLIRDANKTALDAVAELKRKLEGYQVKGQYGSDPFGTGFRQISHLVHASPETRLVYFSSGGFDTHARQAETHATLLKNFSDAVKTFQDELEQTGRDKNVVTLVFSEFGRRAYENSSGGTDHGAAAPMFLIGSSVKAGLHGPKPNLQNLEQGDLKFDVDFRSVYATAIDRWLGGDSGKVLGQKFDSLELL